MVPDELGLKLETAGLDLLGRARKIVLSKDETCPFLPTPADMLRIG
ncbi:hypothetical protein [Spongiactinospora gelatinilytica]|nr:hypothetical protein [Spongiactinospora gelatinilytica]